MAGRAAPLALAGCLLAGTAFVSGRSASGSRHLRAGGFGSSGVEFGNVGSSNTGGFGSGLAFCSAGALLVASLAASVKRGGVRRQAAEIEAVSIPRPEDLLESPKFPKFHGSTSGYFAKATRERHAITWTSPQEFSFEMPGGMGLAIMNKGENLCYFRRKEACICLGKRLREYKIQNYKIYRIKKDGEVVFMHPADGVFPEKVNKGRVQVNGRPFSCGGNPQPGTLKYTKYDKKTYEADPLTTMFVKARLAAFADEENLFPLPNVQGWVKNEDAEKYTEELMERLERLPEPPAKSL